ncbi:MAG: polyphosphate polymerase domain-containing protein [Bacteroidetes bacterium]|nr:polyphosphate polymerase domain-containing protein [Bacteroidota bacterium]HET6244341.1 polyphosphate polymerase domain-containing protein [Bacteroidia bacterium]
MTNDSVLFEQIMQELKDFRSLNLNEMDNVKLMNRTDIKFVFHLDKLKIVLQNLKENYKVLEIMNNRISNYETLYFDTEKYDLYLNHHNGKSNRYKIRCRKYVESNLNFFEIKFKNNKSRTIKNRIKLESIEQSLSKAAKKFLRSIANIKAESLKPVCWINYSRITLVNNDLTERVTLDIDLTMKNEQGEKTFEFLVIAELKQDGNSIKSFFHQVMNKNKIRKISISKYCFGITQLFPKIKQNLFKPKLLTLKKIMYVTS